MPATIVSGLDSNVLSVNSNSEVKIAFNQNKTKAGLIALAAKVGDTQAVDEQICREFDITDDYALRSSIDQLLFYDNFVSTAINTGTWRQATSTYTITQGNGYCTLNSAASNAANVGALISSYKYMPLYGSTTLYVQFQLRATGVTQGLKVIEFGLALVSNATSIVSDGIMFRFGSHGDLRGIRIHNGVEFPTDPINYPILDGEVHQYVIAISMDGVDFFIDGVYVGRLENTNLLDSPTQAGSLPVSARVNVIGGTATIDLPPRVDIFQVQVWSSGNNFARTFGEQMSLMGQNCNNGCTGFGTLGTLSNMSNSFAPTSATLSNTAAPSAGYTGTSLGGEFQFAALGSANTDFIIFGYTVPAAAVASQPRTLVITDLWITTVNTGAAVATTPTVIVWSLGYGSTSISLATSDGAATKAPRRVPIGIQSFLVGDAIGKVRDTIRIQFTTPIVVYTGQVLHVVAKMPVSTATASQVIRGMVGLNGFWEF